MNEIHESIELDGKDSLNLSQNKALSKMASLVLHEIHMPLNTIINHAASLKQTFENAKKENINDAVMLASLKHCIVIEDVANMLMKMVRGLALTEQEKPKDVFVLTALGDIVRTSIEVSRPLFLKSGITFFFDQGQVLEFPVECRPYEIVQVLINLIKNGVEALEQVADRWVRLEMKKIGIFVYFRVIDSGNGISEDVLKKIFEPSFTTKEKNEHGVGLYISRKIIQNHGGELYYEKVNDHTSFVVKLPILQSGKSS